MTEDIKQRVDDAQFNYECVIANVQEMLNDGERELYYEEKNQLKSTLNAQHFLIKELSLREEKLANELKWFCGRVENGEVRSKKTYAKFKATLKDLGLEEKTMDITQEAKECINSLDITHRKHDESSEIVNYMADLISRLVDSSERRAPYNNGEYMKEQTCPTCTGVKNEYLGKYCDAHNVCNTCHIHRSKLGEVIAWGARHGAFLCGTCEKRQRNQRIKERQKAGFDHENTDEIVCPYCGYQESDSWEASDSDDDKECPDCHNIFSYERIVTYTYSSEMKE